MSLDGLHRSCAVTRELRQENLVTNGLLDDVLQYYPTLWYTWQALANLRPAILANSLPSQAYPSIFTGAVTNNPQPLSSLFTFTDNRSESHGGDGHPNTEIVAAPYSASQGISLHDIGYKYKQKLEGIAKKRAKRSKKINTGGDIRCPHCNHIPFNDRNNHINHM